VFIKERALQSHHEKQAANYSCKVLLNCYLRECCENQKQLLKINKHKEKEKKKKNTKKKQKNT